MAAKRLSIVSKEQEEELPLGPEVLATIAVVCSEFFHPGNRSELMRKILQAGVQLTHSDRGTVFLATKDGLTYDPDTLTSNIATGLGSGAIQITSTAGIAGDVFTNDRPLIINEVQKDRRFAPRIDESTGYVTRTLLSVPMHAPFAAVALSYQDTLSTLDDSREKLALNKTGRFKTIEDYSLVSKNPVLHDLYHKLPLFAKSDSSILIEGESGSGKEMVAQVLHQFSDRCGKQFVAINCAAIPESLFEAELFGVAQGAATGTIARKGKIELANGGTLFLDEIGELPLGMQAKLLRVLQDRAVCRVGSEGPATQLNFRILTATNRDLGELVGAGKFREDLYYRINVIRFRVPPLRERIEDIAALSSAMIRRLEVERKLKAKPMSPEALKKLELYHWPGNIRELQNKIESALITSGANAILRPEDFQLDVSALRQNSNDPLGANASLEFDLKKARAVFERGLIERALEHCHGNKTEAARLLGLSREGLRKALLKHPS
jgi:transcriptional regulator with PAS, ATPase and Fis domain